MGGVVIQGDLTITGRHGWGGLDDLKVNSVKKEQYFQFKIFLKLFH